MREGFAIFFEPLLFDTAIDDFLFEENLSWLETVKSWGNDSPGIDRILLSDEDPVLGAERRNPASWALVSFILNSSDEEYRRFLYESILLLDSSASASENGLVIAKRGAMWIDTTKAHADYSAYLASRKTFTELIEAGRNAYAAKDTQTAEKAFYAAEELKPGHYAPYYYLGLLAYERKDYALAENHYKSALQNGADAALVNYALGVNAAADARNADARKYLEQAKKAAPERYSAKADELIARLPK
jgi:tetratricopeptide (TPR) repeat protein